MWPFNRKKESIEKGTITIPAGGRIQLPLPPVRFDRDKCFILFNGREELLDEDGFIAEIKADNSRPLKIKIFPDFKNRKLGAMEIIDIEEQLKLSDDNKEYPKDWPRLRFAGLGGPITINREYMERYIDNVGKQIENSRKCIFKSIKRSRRISYAAIIVCSITTIVQSYFVYTIQTMTRYIFVVLIILNFIAIYGNIQMIKKVNRIDRDISQQSDKSDSNAKGENENAVKNSEIEKIDIVREK